MEIFTLQDAFNRLHSVSSNQAAYWNIYAVVCIAIVSYLGSTINKKKNIEFYLWTTGAFVVFFIANLLEISNSQSGITAAVLSINEFSANHKKAINQAFHPMLINIAVIQKWKVIAFHLTIDICILALLAYSYVKSNRIEPVVIASD